MHDDLQLGAREKVVQQMTRDGLVETNLARKKKQRISERQLKQRLTAKIKKN